MVLTQVLIFFFPPVVTALWSLIWLSQSIFFKSNIFCYVAQVGLKLSILLPQNPPSYGSTGVCATMPGPKSDFFENCNLHWEITVPVIYTFKLKVLNQVLVACSYNPSYLGG
jgi:hypothetical protein